MAKQPEDTRTAELPIETVPRKRGRPSTGTAKTPAERKRAQRERARTYVFGAESERADISVTVTGLIEQLAYAVSQGYPQLARDLADQLIQRAEANKTHTA